MNMTFSIILVGAPILVGARGSCPICPMVNPALDFVYGNVPAGIYWHERIIIAWYKLYKPNPANTKLPKAFNIPDHVVWVNYKC